MGCGFGLDTFIASKKVGSTGKVIAMDLSKGEVKKAKENADARNYTNIEFF